VDPSPLWQRYQRSGRGSLDDPCRHAVGLKHTALALVDLTRCVPSPRDLWVSLMSGRSVALVTRMKQLASSRGRTDATLFTTRLAFFNRQNALAPPPHHLLSRCRH
jgi:hypothetical protein